MRQYIDDILASIVMAVFVLGWIDWLWIFGVEASISRSYTWWALLRHMDVILGN